MAQDNTYADLLSLVGKIAGGATGKSNTQVQSTSSNTTALTFNPSINVQSPASAPDLRTYQSPISTETVSAYETDGSGRAALPGTLKIPSTGAIDIPETSRAGILDGLMSNPMLLLIIGAAAFLLFSPGKGKGA